MCMCCYIGGGEGVELNLGFFIGFMDFVNLFFGVMLVDFMVNWVVGFFEFFLVGLFFGVG